MNAADTQDLGETAADIEGLLAERRRRIGGRIEGLSGRLKAGIEGFAPFVLTGRVRKVVGTIIHAAVPDVQVGEIVELYNRSSGSKLLAECVGFLNEEALLSPIGETQGVSPQTEVRRTSVCGLTPCVSPIGESRASSLRKPTHSASSLLPLERL